MFHDCICTLVDFENIRLISEKYRKGERGRDIRIILLEDGCFIFLMSGVD